MTEPRPARSILASPWRRHGHTFGPWRDGDATAMFEAVRESVHQLGRWLPWCTPGYALDRCRSSASRLPGGLAHRRALRLRHSRSRWPLLGASASTSSTGFTAVANLGYWIRVSGSGKAWRRGPRGWLARFGFAATGVDPGRDRRPSGQPCQPQDCRTSRCAVRDHRPAAHLVPRPGRMMARYTPDSDRPGEHRPQPGRRCRDQR